MRFCCSFSHNICAARVFVKAAETVGNHYPFSRFDKYPLFLGIPDTMPFAFSSSNLALSISGITELSSFSSINTPGFSKQ